jgi:O-antigen ligase
MADKINKIYYYLFLALSFAIPIHDKIVPLIIALIGINWLLEFKIREKMMRLRNIGDQKILLLPMVLYFVYIIGTFYSTQLRGQSGAIFDLEVKLSLVLFPLFFSTIDFSKLGNDFFKQVLKAFVYGCLVSSIIIINKAVMDYFKEQDSSVFYYSNLSWLHHPSYLALYFTFAIAILLTWIMKNGNKIILKRNLMILLIIHFQIFIVLLSSKAGIIGFFIIWVLITIWFMIKKYELKRTLIVSLIIIAAFILSVFIFPVSIIRFQTAKKSIEESHIPENQKTEGSAARLMIWKSSLEVIKENFLFGVGTGDVKTELIKKYEENGILLALKENLNAHNQYLQTFIALGFVGFIILLACLILPVISAIKQRNILIILFFLLFAFHLTVESMLERQGGVVFFAFFYSLLLSPIHEKQL